MGSASNFSLQLEARNGVTRIALAGELDMASAPAFDACLAEAEGSGTQAIMLDLRNLTFIDSSGLHAMLRGSARAKANGHRLAIVGANEAARQLFEMTGTESLVDQQDVVSVLDRFTRDGAARTPEWPSDRTHHG